ncbi:MAG: ribonuclease HII [Verrucomicrobia bacterium]|nr:ribonuclease HII [Verrucomicrobiota bacterium]
MAAPKLSPPHRRSAQAVDRFAFERALHHQGTTHLAGVDEAGRGPLAGPVVAAAVVLPEAWIEAGLPAKLSGLNDSKQLTARQRERFFEFLTHHALVRYAVAQADAATIDAINILRATHGAMNQALAALQPPPQHVLVDGLRVPSLAFPQTALVRGDARSYLIAAASVLAKVNRDRLMHAYDREFPAYGFARHKGYATPQHLAALAEHGPCPIHRRSFAPVRVNQPELFPAS